MNKTSTSFESKPSTRILSSSSSDRGRTAWAAAATLSIGLVMPDCVTGNREDVEPVVSEGNGGTGGETWQEKKK
jgi:hypothetical protein